MLNKYLTLALAGTFLLPVESSLAAEDALALEEIVVTARKRNESLQDVPISITTVTGEELRHAGIQRMDGLAATIPNLHYSFTPSATDALYIRGIGSAVNFGFETAAGTVIDGFYYGKTKIGRSAFLDLERIEVLKGPQGAVLGKNNTAGAVNLTTAKPTDEFEGGVTATATFEGNDGYSVEAFVSGPLTETLGGRFAIRNDDADGWIDNETTGEKEQTLDDWTGRGILVWDPSEDLSVMASYQRVDFTHRGHGRELFSCGPGKTAQLQGGDCEVNLKKNSGASPGEVDRDRFTQELDMAHLAINWNVGDLTLTSLTGILDYETLDEFDSDNTVTNAEFIIIPEDYKRIMQELRLSGSSGNIDFLVGAFFMKAEQDNQFRFQLGFGGPTVDTSIVVSGTQDTDVYALFGEVTIPLSDTVDITLGGRYTDEEKNLEQEFYFTVPFTDDRFATLYSLSPDRTEKDFSPTLDVRWALSDAIKLYGSVRTGFRGGGFDRFLFAFGGQPEAEANIEFDTEEVISFEIGAKMELLDNSMRLNLALFRSEYDELQLASFTGSAFRVDNAASSVSQGIEAELDWQASERLRVKFNVGLLDGEFDEFKNAACYAGQTAAQGCDVATGTQDLSGESIPFAPDVSASLSATHTMPLGDDLELTLFGEYNYSSEIELSDDLDPEYRQDSYPLINARIGLSNLEKTWDVSLIGRNLSDELVKTWGSDSNPDGRDAFINPPLVVSLQASFRF